MQIEISLPEYPSGTENTEAVTLSWLKQLELAVHHAQKSVKEMSSMLRERDAETDDPLLKQKWSQKPLEHIGRRATESNRNACRNTSFLRRVQEPS